MPSKTLRPFVILDTETSGLKSQTNAITEIAMVAIAGDTLREIGRYESKVEYQYNHALVYDQRALDITGITIDDLLNSGLPIKEVVDKTIELFEKANKHGIGKFSKLVLVGHNFGFDVGFLQAIFNHCKKDLSKYVTGRDDFYGKFQPEYIDTLSLSWMKWQDDETMNDFKLGTVVEKAGLELSDAHRAMNDVLANKDVFVSFANDLRVDNSGVQGMNRKTRNRAHFQF